jgi:hypothetical protein
MIFLQFASSGMCRLRYSSISSWWQSSLVSRSMVILVAIITGMVIDGFIVLKEANEEMEDDLNSVCIVFRPWALQMG